MSRVLVLGGSGFIGTNLNLINSLQARDVKLYGFKRNESFRLSQNQEIAEFIKQNKVETLISLAWPLGIDYRSNSLNTLIAEQTFNLYLSLENVIKKFISIGTFSETMQDLDGTNSIDQSLYAQSKRNLTKALFGYPSSMTKSTTLRIGCPYGPFDRETRLIPSLIKATANKNDIALRNPHLTLPIVHVFNIATKLLSLINDDTETSNCIVDYFGNSFLTVREIQEAIKKIFFSVETGKTKVCSMKIRDVSENSFISLESGILDLIFRESKL